jgi:signal transduction histidine kinase
VSVAITGKGLLPPDVQVTFYRLCQEALSNVAKHALEAQQVTIELRHAPGAVELRIRDDGRGFDPDDTPAGQTGLSIMRERAATIGAVLTITSHPGKGTEVIARWADTAEKEAA